MTFRLVSAGYLVLGLILIIVFLALSSPSNSNFALFFAFSLISISLVSIWLTRRNISGLHITPDSTSRPSTPDEPLKIKLYVENPSQLHRPSLTLRMGNLAIKRFEIPPSNKQLLEIELNHNGRGCYQISQLNVTTDYPIGLFQCRLLLPLTLQAWVIPTAPLGSYNPPTLMTPNLHDNTEMDGLYEYVAGDPINRIHWKSYAKTQQLTVKRFTEELSATQPHCWLDWPINQHSTETRILQLVAQADWAQRQQIPFGLRLPNIEIPLGWGDSHYRQCLFQLANFECPTEQLAPGLTRSSRSAS